MGRLDGYSNGSICGWHRRRKGQWECGLFFLIFPCMCLEESSISAGMWGITGLVLKPTGSKQGNGSHSIARKPVPKRPLRNGSRTSSSSSLFFFFFFFLLLFPPPPSFLSPSLSSPVSLACLFHLIYAKGGHAPAHLCLGVDADFCMFHFFRCQGLELQHMLLLCTPPLRYFCPDFPLWIMKHIQREKQTGLRSGFLCLFLRYMNANNRGALAREEGVGYSPIMMQRYCSVSNG